MITTAVIMAAGKGTRFGNRTADMPKGFIPFKGKPMIERSIENLLGVGIAKIIIGTGFHSEWYDRIAEKYPQINTVFSPCFAESNSMETLYVCRHAIGEDDILLLESDIIYESKALKCLLNDKHTNIMLASEITKFQDQYYIGVNPDKTLCCCSTQKEKIHKFCKEIYGEMVGIHKLSNRFYKKMIEDYGQNIIELFRRGYEFEMEDISTSQLPLFVLKLKNLLWYEIDDENDMLYAENYVGIN